MKTMRFFAIAAMTIVAFTFASCEKEETSPLAEVMLQDDEVADYFNDILSEADDFSFSDGPAKSGLAEFEIAAGTRTHVVSYSGDTVIHTITYVNFSHPRRPDRVKNGVIVVKIVGRYMQSTFWRRIELIDFSINGNNIEGTKVVEKTGDYMYSVTLTGGRVEFTDGTFYTREFERVRTWTAGYNTPAVIADDEYSLTGSASGINRRGNSYVHTITSPLILKMNCRWIVQGIIEFVANNQTAVLDYGDGTCDRIATLTVNGEAYTINLRGNMQ